MLLCAPEKQQFRQLLLTLWFDEGACLLKVKIKNWRGQKPSRASRKGGGGGEGAQAQESQQERWGVGTSSGDPAHGGGGGGRKRKG